MWKRRRKLPRLQYLENEKSFLEEIKRTFFTDSEGLSFNEKKNLIKNRKTKFKKKFLLMKQKSPETYCVQVGVKIII